MKIEFPVPFVCPRSLEPHLEKVFKGEYEVPLHGAFNIIDLGANVGAFSVWAAHRFPGSKIHAYEPNPDCYPYFNKNVNFLPSVSLHEWGIGEPGWRILMNGENNLGEASLHPGGCRASTGKHVEIRSPMTLPRADILKMDIEGSEIEVLGPLIREGREFAAVMIEYHNEELRRECDQLLSDYVIVRAEVAEPQRGTLCYLRRNLLKS